MTVNRRILLTARPDGLVTEDCLDRVEEPSADDRPTARRWCGCSASRSTRRTGSGCGRRTRTSRRSASATSCARPGSARSSRAGATATTPGDLVIGLPGWQELLDARRRRAGAGRAAGHPARGHAEHLRRDRRDRVLRAARDRAAAAGRDRRGVGRGAAASARSPARSRSIKDAGRVVGIAGTDEKCRWVVEDLGFDACINYKTEDVDARLRELCPDGIDVFFDNVGGEILDAVLARSTSARAS